MGPGEPRSGASPAGESAATVAVLLVLGAGIAIADWATAGTLRGPMALLVPVGLATWRSGRAAGLTVVVLGTVAAMLVDLRGGLDATAFLARGLDLLVLSLAVGVVSAGSDHVRRQWPASLLHGAGSQIDLTARLALELDRLRARPGTLALAVLRIHTEGGEDDPSQPVPGLDRIVEDLRGTLRGLDVAARDGNALWLLLPDTDGVGARLALERHRARIGDLGRAGGSPLRVSAGAVVLHRPVPGTQAIRRALDAGTLAGGLGRNKVVVVEWRGEQ